ncbi:MAG: hypothetical protein CL920_27350 [Deltaproteobacteria bacterium]|mgnify:CR=1 FL=1|nr:hypothetical protein [Deltaproteobacteria bacterium]MBU52428.1 hypothetical protein [Deltaproteobacteria bacterium]
MGRGTLRFFIGAIALNVSFFFRGIAFQRGGLLYIIWVVCVLLIGTFMVHSIYLMRQQREKNAPSTTTQHLEEPPRRPPPKKPQRSTGKKKKKKKKR